MYIANATRHQVHTWYTHARGVWVDFLEHGGGAPGIFKSPVGTENQSWTFVPFTLFFLPNQAQRANSMDKAYAARGAKRLVSHTNINTISRNSKQDSGFQDLRLVRVRVALLDTRYRVNY